MKILAVDTALGACSVALLSDDKILAHIFEPMDRGHAERLAPMVDEAMTQANLDFPELDRLAVTTGPGTFTGQRVGLAFMRGLRLALKRPLAGLLFRAGPALRLPDGGGQVRPLTSSRLGPARCGAAQPGKSGGRVLG